MKCRKCGIECIDAGFGHCKKCLAVPKFGITIREILQKVYNDGMLAGAKSTGKRNYESVEGAIAEIDSVIRGLVQSHQGEITKYEGEVMTSSREVLEDKIQDILYSNMFEKDGSIMGHCETIDKILAVIAEIVRKEKKDTGNLVRDSDHNDIIDHIASLFEEDKDGR